MEKDNGDNVERTFAEKTLQSTQDGFEGFFNASDDFLFIIDEQGNILKANITVINRLGYSEDELIGKSVLMIHPPERREEASHIVSEMLTGKTRFCPVPVISKTGIQIPVETRITHGFWQGKRVLFGVTKDITTITLSEEKFSKVFHLNPSACSLSNLGDDTYIEVNEAFSVLFGFQKAEIIGKTVYDLGIMSVETRESILLQADNGRVVSVEASLIAKNGDIKHVLISADNIYVQDKQYRFTVVNDITERRQAEEIQRANSEKYRLLVDNSHDIIYTLTNEGLFTFVSPAWTTLLGHPINQVVDHQFQPFVHPDDLSICLSWLQKIIETKQRQEGVEYRVKHIDGSWRWHTSSAVPIFNEFSENIGFEGMARDITEQRKNLNSIQNYAHMLTHDLRNFLTPVQGFSGIISEGGLSPEDIIQYAQIIHTSGKNALNLINTYLLLEKIERGQACLVKEEKTIFEIIDQIKKVFSDLDNNGCILNITKKTINTNFPYPGFFQKIIAIDVTLFTSILCNLLKNGIEAVSNKSKKIDVNIYEEDSSLCLSISNLGEIPKDIQKNLFQKFTTSKSKGTGIGLYSAKLLVEIQGGKLIYKLLPERTEFIVQIPYVL